MMTDKHNLKNQPTEPANKRLKKNSKGNAPLSILNKFNNYCLNDVADRCYCSMDLIYRHEQYEGYKPETGKFNISSCLRNLLYKENLMKSNKEDVMKSNKEDVMKSNKQNLLWLDIKKPLRDLIDRKFHNKLSSSLGLRQDIGLTNIADLKNSKALLEFISSLIEETISFYSTVDSKKYIVSPNDAILSFFKTKLSVYKQKKTNQNLDYFADTVNPILLYNLKYAQNINCCLSPKGMTQLIDLCKKKCADNSNTLAQINYENMVKQKDYIQNNIKSNIIVVPFLHCIETSIQKLNNFKALDEKFMEKGFKTTNTKIKYKLK